MQREWILSLERFPLQKGGFSMKAVVIKEFGSHHVLRIEDLPLPAIKRDEVLIKVFFTSINHLDIWVRSGLTAYGTKLPHIPGCDISGIVVEKGEEVEELNIGDRVLVDPGIRCFKCEFCLAGRDNICRTFGIIGATIDGGYREYAAFPKRNVIRISENIPLDVASAFPLTYMTSWHMLIDRAGLKPGERILIIGGTSGIGVAALQISRLIGAEVIATAGSDEKLEFLIKQGADHVINHEREDIYERVKELTHREGVDVVFEHVGPLVFEKCVKSLKKGGRLVTCGATSGQEVRLDLRYIFSRQLSIMGSIMGTRYELLRIIHLVERGLLKPVIDSIYPLMDAGEAHKKMEERRHIGKILLRVAD